MANPTYKTRWNAKVEAHQLHGALTGLATRFEANDLDAGAIKKATKALAEVADEVQRDIDATAAAKAKYHASVGPAASAVEELRRENEELKKRLAANVVR
jgi:hypothetical protein